MISRETLLQLASLQSPTDSAISFYYQPQPPQDKSHRDEAILLKDLVRQAHNGGHQPSEKDLQRILGLAETLVNNHARGKALFACEALGIWQEFEIPVHPFRTQLIVNRRFHLRPLAMALASMPQTCILLIDRKRARIFELIGNAIRQTDDIFDDLPRRGRSDGFAGYDAGHVERHLENEAMHHVKRALERVLEHYNAVQVERFVIACRDEVWSEVEPHLHPYLRQALAGRFSSDVATATPEQLRDQAERVLQEQAESRRQGLIREVLGETQRNARGATGLRHVLEALEMGEVQALLLGENFSAAAVECPNCGHVDTRTAPGCAVCGKPTRPLEDVADALVTLALRNHAELVLISADADFDRVGNVAALLRFRADQNTPAKVAS